MAETSSITVVPYSKKNVFLRLNNIEEKPRWDKLMNKIGSSWNGSDRDPGWLLGRDKLDLYYSMVKEYGSRNRTIKRSRFRNNNSNVKKEEHNDEKEEEEESSESESENESENESDSDTDDELIIKTLARKLKYESSHKEIDESEVENSDLEDVVSLCRRIRHLYKIIKNQQQRILKLESRLLD